MLEYYPTLEAKIKIWGMNIKIGDHKKIEVYMIKQIKEAI